VVRSFIVPVFVPDSPQSTPRTFEQKRPGFLQCAFSDRRPHFVFWADPAFVLLCNVMSIRFGGNRPLRNTWTVPLGGLGRGQACVERSEWVAPILLEPAISASALANMPRLRAPAKDGRFIDLNTSHNPRMRTPR
jgi:hypothetical protein